MNVKKDWPTKERKTITTQISAMDFQTVPRTSLIEPKKPRFLSPSPFGRGTVLNRSAIIAKPNSIVYGDALRPYEPTK